MSPILCNGASDDTSGFRILAVDDEPVNLQVLTNHLTLAGFEVAMADNGVEAIKHLSGPDRFDLVLLDVMMPKMSGYEVCRWIRRRYSVQELPVIFLTARNQTEDRAMGFEVGGNDYLTKPVSKNELMPRLKTHLQLLDIHRDLERKVAARTRELELSNRELVTLDRIVKVLNRETSLSRVWRAILEQGMSLIPKAELGLLLVPKPGESGFDVVAQVGHGLAKKSNPKVSFDEVLQMRTDFAERIRDGIYLVREIPKSFSLLEQSAKSLLAMSLRPGDKLRGLLVFTSRASRHAFDHSDAEMLGRYREHASSAVIRARLVRQLEERHEALLRRQDQLIVQNKMASLGTLTAGVAHEIRNPINFVNNFGQLIGETALGLRREIQSRVDPNDLATRLADGLEELVDNAEIVCKHGARMEGVVSGILGLYSQDAAETGVVDLNRLVKDAVEAAFYSLQGHYGPQRMSVPVDARYDNDIGLVSVQSQSLNRALVNLLVNALEAVYERGLNDDSFQPALEIRTQALDAEVEIRVRDNGGGIAETDRERLFSPFFTTKVNQGNIGLGLFTSYDIIVRQHQGKLEITSEPESFTEAVIRLPKSTAETKDEAAMGGRTAVH